jgi:translocation and assembly module TamB
VRYRPRRSLLRFALVLLLLLTATAAFLRTQFAWREACTQARKRLPGLLGMQVEIGRCEIDPLSQDVRLEQVRATRPGDSRPSFEADSIRVSVPSVSIFTREVRIDEVELRGPHVRVDLRAPAPSAKSAGCPFDTLSHVAIGHLDVKGAELELALPEGRSVQVSGLSLGWHERRGLNEFHVEATQGQVGLGDANRDLALAQLSLEGGFDRRGGSLEIAKGEIGLEDLDLLVSGKIEQLCDPTVTLDAQLFVPLRTAFKAAGLHASTAGHLWARATLSGHAAAPVVNGELVGQGLAIDRFRPGDFTARLSGDAGELRVGDFSTQLGPGKVHVSGALKLARGLPVRARAELDSAQFGRILERSGLPGSWVDFLASGKVSVAGTLSPLQLTGDTDLKVKDFALATRPFDKPQASGKHLLKFAQGSVKTKVAIFPDRVELGSGEYDAGRTHVAAEVTLFFDSQKGLTVRGKAEPVQLDDLHDIAGLRLSGSGTAQFELTGPYNKVVIDGSMALRDFTFWDFALGVTEGHVTYRDGVLGFPALSGQKGRTQFFGSGNLDFTGRELRSDGQVTITAGRVEDLVDAIAGLSPSMQVLQNGVLTGQTTGTIAIHGPSSHWGGRCDFDVKDARYYGRRVGDGQVAIEFRDGRSMVLLPTTFTGPLGVTRADGTFSFNGSLDYRFRVDPMALSELIGPELAKAAGLSGALTLVGKVEGDSTTPIVSGYLTAPRIALGDRSLGPAHLEGRMEGRDGQIWGKPFDDATLSSNFTLRTPFPYKAVLHLSVGELRALLPASLATQGLSGALAGTLEASGQLLDPNSQIARARFERFTISRGDVHLANEVPIQLDLKNGRLDVTALSLVGPGTSLSVSGWAGPSQADLKLDGQLDLKWLESFFPAIERAGGRLELLAEATGPLRKLNLVGSAELSDAHLRMRDQPLELKGFSGRADFSEARVLLEDLQGTLNDGKLSVHGELGLNGLLADRVQVEAELGDVVFRPMEDLPVTTNGELVLSGAPGHLALAGDVELTRLRYDRPFVFDAFMRDVGHARGLGANGEPARPWLALDVGMHVKDARIENNVARAKIVGELRLTGNNVQPGLLGTLEATEGSQAFFRGNEFNISQGVVEFKDRQGLDGVFDVHAETEAREYVVRLHAFGRTSDPHVLLSAEPDLAEGDIISLLTLGVISKDKTNTAGTSAGLAAEALFNASGLDRQVQRFLPKNSVLRDLAFHISTTYNDATGLVEPTAQIESKFLTEKLKLTMSQPVSGHGSKAQAEYRFTDRLSAQAQWDNEHQDFAFGNLGMDLKLRWDVE